MMNLEPILNGYSKLLPSEKAQLERWTRELERRTQQERIREFKPTTIPFNDQKAVLCSPAKERWVFGGNRSGKTEITTVDNILLATGEHPVRTPMYGVPTFSRYVGKSWQQVNRVILKKFKNMCIRDTLLGRSWDRAFSKQEHILSFANGSMIYFQNSEQDVDKHGGDDLHAIYFDEHHPKKYYDEGIMRLVDYDGYLMGSMTPEEGITWEWDHINDPPEGVNIEHWFFNTMDNPHLSKQGRQEVLNAIRDPKLREAKLFGQFLALGGLVIPQYRSDKCLVPDFPLEKHWPKTVIIDPHLKKPTAIMWLCWIEDEVVVIYRTRKVKMPVGELAQYIKAQTAPDGKIGLWIADEAQGGKGTNIFGSESVIAQLNELGLPFMPTNQSSDKAFEAGINKLQGMFTPDPITDKPGILIFESNLWPSQWIDGKTYGNIDWELKRYQYKKEQKSDEETFRERVRTVDDDLIDCLRYGVMAGPSMDTGSIVVVNSSRGNVDPFTGW